MYKLDPPALLFETSRPGRKATVLPPSDVPERPLDELLPARQRAAEPPPLPELGELDVVRHYTNLSVANMAIDSNFYPLGSCTMKYNPKRNERLAALPGLAGLHPYQDESTLQGILQLLFELQADLAEIAGLDAVSLQPAAGAQGELTALLIAAAHFRRLGERRTKVLIPDSAHGTNPASAHLAGFEAVTIKSNAQGLVDLDDFEQKLDPRTAVFMITNPNTLGLFDHQVGVIARRLHDQGALLYLDGANMNAILGVARPGEMGVDLMHYNPHKTFSGPHGGGGPGAGPIAVREQLARYLPTPLVVRDGDRYRLDHDRPDSIGRVRSFFGNVGVLVRAYCYIRSHGPEGLRQVAQHAVLNANYLMALVRDLYPVPHGERCMHEFVASARTLLRDRSVRAMDVAKRLLDHNVHAPTVYFPLIVPEALMIEPTETESRETLDQFAAVLKAIAAEPPELLREAPHSTPISRPDEVLAARSPVLRWSAPAPRPRPMICRVLPHRIADGPTQMALDEALLETVSETPSAAVFRTYEWAEPTLSLGYFQPVAAVEADPRWQRVPLVRRADRRRGDLARFGPHVRPGRPRRGGRDWPAARLYDAVHEVIRNLIGPRARRAESRPQDQPRPFLCFLDRDPHDLVLDGAKVAGSAQRRRAGASLQHGSILLRRSDRLPELSGLTELLGTTADSADWSARLRAALPAALGFDARPDLTTRAEESRCAALRHDRFARDSWTRRR